MVLMITRDIRRAVTTGVTTGDHTDSQGEDRGGGSKHYYIPLATNDRLFQPQRETLYITRSGVPWSGGQLGVECKGPQLHFK